MQQPETRLRLITDLNHANVRMVREIEIKEIER
jgi:hypothetical protein